MTGAFSAALMTDGAVVSLMPVLVTAIRKRRTFGAVEFFSPGLAWLVPGAEMTVEGRALRRAARRPESLWLQQSGEATRKRHHRKTLPDIGKKWWAMRDSNSRHPRCKRGALPTELIALSRCRTSVRRVGGRDLCVTGENRKSVRAIFSNFLSRTGAPGRKSVDKLGGEGRRLARQAAHCWLFRCARI